MNFALERQTRRNFFTDFSYDEWVTESFCESHSRRYRYDIREYERLLSHFEDLDQVEACFAICWQQIDAGFFNVEEYRNYWLATIEWLTSSDLTSEDEIVGIVARIREGITEYEAAHSTMYRSCLELLPDLVSRHRPEIRPDGYVLDRDAITYIHLAVGNALMLENIERAKSERYWELIEDALTVIKTPRTESIPSWYSKRPEIQESIEISVLLVEAYIWANLFHKSFLQNDFEKALECLNEAAALCEEICDENAEAFHQDSLGVFEWMAKRPKDYPAIQTIEIGAHLIAHIVPAQKAVEAFEGVFKDDQRSTDWDQIAEICRSLGNIWEHYRVGVMVQSAITGEYTEAVTYWQIARALAEQKISPDAVVDVVRAARDRETETRLRLYFFPEEWKNMPEKARASLISADREYERADGKRPIIFDHLRSATRAIIVEKFWKPYHEYLREKARAGLKDTRDLDSVKRIIEDELAEPDLAPLLKAPYFDEFLRTTSDDPRFIRRLPNKLMELNKWANKVSHEHHWGYRGFESRVRDTYAEYLGIGRSGILPRLMRLRPNRNHRNT